MSAKHRAASRPIGTSGSRHTAHLEEQLTDPSDAARDREGGPNATLWKSCPGLRELPFVPVLSGQCVGRPRVSVLTAIVRSSS
ncbi:hypothetical protein BN10_1700009 [Phycicoccus elongatus Lp2]|uniref:Uncharacterized protein n=1 Tax=Phycicoccus elongatus Lp2 TaxID=1193181 RepID=N0DYE8_9MICO|nr:hypothetical protein BN10_1700009 [Phycicoccus elongatus Lp2]